MASQCSTHCGCPVTKPCCNQKFGRCSLRLFRGVTNYHCIYAAAPLYEERNAIVNGEKDVPAPKEEEGEPKEEEGPVPAGIPEFWLGVLRANRMIGDSVSLFFPNLFTVVAFSGTCVYLVIWEGPRQNAHRKI
jgi:hypothetical protein